MICRDTVNTFGSEQNCLHFVDNFFKGIFLNKNYCVMIQIVLEFVPKDQIDNKWNMIWLMALCQIEKKPLL